MSYASKSVRACRARVVNTWCSIRLTPLLVALVTSVALSSCGNPSGAPRTAKKQLVFLTWNLPGYEPSYRRMIAEFEATHPDFEVKLIDKKGTEWPAYFRTSVIAGTQPDVIDVQGALWAEYAEDGMLLDLTPMLSAEPEVRARFFPSALSMWEREGRFYMLPFYFTKTLLVYNKLMFQKAGISAPPENFDELLEYAGRMSGNGSTGLITLNMEWAYWTLFALNDIELLSADGRAVAFDTPRMVEVLGRLARATREGHIDKLSWTGRWVEPNSAFATGSIGMYQASSSALFWTAAKADWMNPDTIGVAHMPRGVSVPSTHGYGIARTTKYPQAAWELIKLATSERWQKVFSDNFTVLTLNRNVDLHAIEALEERDPLKAAVLRESLANLDKLTANWGSPLDARIQDAFYPPIQAALLGEKEPEEAVEDAARAVDRVLRRAR